MIGRGRVWLALWGGGAAWLAHFLTIWALAEFGCQTALARPGPLGVSPVAWLIVGATVVAAALAAGATVLAWRTERSAGEGAGVGDVPGDGDVSDAVEAVTFTGRIGWVAGGFFTLVILVEAAPVLLYLRGCGEGAP